MSLVNAITDDDDNRSLASSADSDLDPCQSYRNTHRSCSLYGPCDKSNHQHSSIDCTSSKPVKGDIRSVDNQPRHRQKYDGAKWRRICCIADCLRCLNGGVYYENWLCKKHYLLTSAVDICSDSDNSSADKTYVITRTKKRISKASAPKPNKKTKPPKRGDVMVKDDGTRQKYDGKSWRPTCTYDKCISYIVRHGYCHRHDMETRKKPPEIVPSSAADDDQQPISQSQITRSPSSTITKPKKGDVQLIRQQWNGTKWYSLCHHHSRDCSRRSAGIKCAYLCDAHFKEYQENKRKGHIPLSPTIKRQKLINDNNRLSLNIPDKQKSTTLYQSKSTVDQMKQTEQCIQTDLTYPLESSDLRQGCFLIDDDNYDQYESESSQLMCRIKKEEEDYLANARKMSMKNSMEINGLPINCKLELTKIEF